MTTESCRNFKTQLGHKNGANPPAAWLLRAGWPSVELRVAPYFNRVGNEMVDVFRVGNEMVDVIGLLCKFAAVPCWSSAQHKTVFTGLRF